MKIQFKCLLKPTSSITTKITKKINKPTNSLFCAATPAVFYYNGENADNALNRLINKMKELDLDIPTNYKPNPDTLSGLDVESKGRFRTVINDAAKDGKISQREQQELLNKVAFTGAPDEEVSETSGFQLDSSGNIDLESIDTNMCPELETIYNASPLSTPDGLVETIFDELPGGVDIDMDLWSMLKNLASDILNPGDLL